MGALDDPAPGSPFGVKLAGFDFLVATLDMGDHRVRSDLGGNIATAVAAVKAQPDLRARLAQYGRRRRDHQCFKRRLEQLGVVAVCAGDRQSDRDALRVAEHRAFGPALGSVGGVWARIRTPREAPW